MQTAGNPDVPSSGPPPDERELYHCGTLTYTKMTLFAVLAGLLWGNFCLTLDSTVLSKVLPLNLKLMHCPNRLMGLIVTSLPAVLNIALCPYISFKSDRYRSRWGRRIPFILVSMPFLCVSLALIGWSREISAFLQSHVSALSAYAPASVTIALVAFLVVMYSFFVQFVGSVFWCLFNDVIPPEMAGRVTGRMTIVSMLANTLFMWFVFQYAETHMREIFTGSAILFLAAFGYVCLAVKEGEYPPIEGEKGRDNRGIGWIQVFLKQCFTDKFYWLSFSAGAFATISASGYIFLIFFQKQMGLTLAQVGKVAAINGVITMAAVYVGSVFVDRWHPIRIRIYMGVFFIVANIVGCVWIFVTLPGNYFFWVFAGQTFIAVFQSALIQITSLPLQMRLYPKSRFGQFCAAQSLLNNVCLIGAGFAAGGFIDVIAHFCHDPDFAYRFVLVWICVFSGAASITMLIVYRHWHRLGGFKGYRPPAPWRPEKSEEMPIMPVVGAQTRWMKIAFRLFDATMALSVLGIPVMMWWMRAQGALLAYKWFGVALLPLSVAAWVWWEFVKRGIRKDMERARNHEPLRCGIPHHGLLIVAGTKVLLMLSLWVVEIVVTVHLNMESSAIIFGITNVATNFLLIGAIQVLRWVESGISVTIDEAPVDA